MKRVVALVLGFVMLMLSCAFVAVSDDKETEDIEFYLHDDYIVKNESEYNAKMLDYASQLFTRVYEEQLSSSNDVYFALIPDKHRIVNGVVDYKSFLKYMESSLPFAETIEIAQLLTLSDYYKTDPHWKQECIVDVAKTLCESMGTSVDTEFKTISINAPYNGVYVEQSGLHTSSDVLNYLEWDGLDAVLLEGANAVYDVDKFYDDDPYDVFLSGNQSIVKIKNQTIENEKRLVIFRDSFGSSIAPIMSTAYSEIVLIDLRYIMSESLSEYVDFENADVLFLYSTLLLNNSMSMK
ncbi:MAG: hypothetical protein IJ275_00585 [Ruminococcus sp.]|nr:hypothetical protein [Ruminococcus sp.]